MKLYCCSLLLLYVLLFILVNDISCDITCFDTLPTSTDVCSGKGICIAQDTCTCFDGWTSDNCSQPQYGFTFSTGQNDYGQIGDSFTGTTKTTPYRVAGWFIFQSVQAIATGSKFSLALTSSGQVYAWGRNDYGQLGLGDRTTRLLPTLIPNLQDKKIVGIAACVYHGLAVDANGTVYAWGTNTLSANNGWLGSGDTTDSLVPRAISDPSFPRNVVNVYCGRYHSVALTRTGKVWIWGSNQAGQCGDATTINRPTPQQVTLVIESKVIVSIRTGNLHTVALSSEGMVYNWGSSSNGNLGDGSDIAHLVTAPYRVTGLLSGKFITAIGANNIASYAVADGELYAWGGNSNGQLCDGTSAQRSLAVKSKLPATLPYVSGIFTGPHSNNIFMLSNTSALFAVGENSYGQFGIGTTAAITTSAVAIPKLSERSTPVLLAPGETHALWAVTSTTCFSVFSDDPNVCTGHGICIEKDLCVCNDTFVDVDCSLPICYGFNASAPEVCSGHGQCLTTDTCVCYDGYLGQLCNETNTGYLYGSGSNIYGELADFNVNMNQYIPVLSTAFRGKSIRSVASGTSFSLILTSDNELYTVGLGDRGQLANGALTSSSDPVRVEGILTNVSVTAMCAGYQHALVVDVSGNLYAFGENANGQLGDGTKVRKTTPIQVGGILANQTVVAVSCGYSHSVVLTSNATVYTFGSNVYGQIGDGTSGTDRTLPVQVYMEGLLYKKRVGAIAAGNYYTMGLVADGSVYGFGVNSNGQIGDGTTATRIVPTKTGGSLTKRVVRISAAACTSYAIANDGSLFSWGFSSNGQLGTGSTAATVANPTAVGGILSGTIVTGLSSGLAASCSSHTLVITANGTFGIGYNAQGQLGDGTVTAASTPTRFNWYYPNRRVVAVAAGLSHSLVLYDATKVCFGILPDDPRVCSYHGQCNTTDVCECDEGYSGPDCSEFSCFGVDRNQPSVCSGRGVCVAVDTCVCRMNETFVGSNCEIEKFGQVYSFGRNLRLQFGDDDKLDTKVPVPVGGYMYRKMTTHIQAGDSFSMFRTQEQSVFTIGNNYAYYLGDGSTATRSSPYPTLNSPPYNVTHSICAGPFHALAIDENARVVGWGSTFLGDMTSYCGYSYSICNYKVLGGQFNQYTRGVSTPTVLTMPSGHQPLSVACGRGNSAVLTDKGRIISFGINDNGEAGTGLTASYGVAPALVLGILRELEVIQMSVGYDHTLVLSSTGQVFAYGANANGQLGDGTKISKPTPIPVLGELSKRTVVYVVAGMQASYALTNDGTLYTWGMNSKGTLGLGDTVSRVTPTLVSSLSGVRLVSLSANLDSTTPYVVAIAENGTCYSFGTNTYYNLGDGTNVQRNSPVQMQNPMPNSYVVDVILGTSHTVLLYNGTYCYGILSDDKFVCSNRGNCTGRDTCVCETGYIGNDCSIPVCFGLNSTDVEVCSSNGFCVAYDSCTCSIGYSGRNCETEVYGYPMAVGSNSLGQLGDDYYDDRKTFDYLAYPLYSQTYIKYIVSGADTSFAITRNNELWAWGSSQWGNLGDGQRVNRNRPYRVMAGTNYFIDVCSNTFHTAAVDSSGNVWAWGMNNVQLTYTCSYNGIRDCSPTSCPCSTNNPQISGLLGVGTHYYSNSPLAVSGIPANEKVVRISCGLHHTVASTESGKVYSWGRFDDGSVSYATSAVLIGSNPLVGGMLGGTPTYPAKNIIAVSSGDYHSMALTDRGDVWVWGAGTSAQLGDSYLTTKFTPRQVLGNLFKQSVVRIAAARTSSYALTSDGNVFVWGTTQLGLGATTQSVVPVMISTLSNISDITTSKGNDFVIALHRNGTLFTWGLNQFSQLLDNSTTTRTTPYLVASPFTERYPVALAAGKSHSIVLYSGVFCSGVLSDDPSVCSYRGACVAPDTCQCNSGYTGANCSIAICNGIAGNNSSACSGHGLCLYNNTCICSPGYVGIFCDSEDQRFLFASGDNSFSQLGDGLFVSQNYPRQATLLTPKTFHFMSAGDGYGFAVNLKTGVLALGTNSLGQLGDGTDEDRFYPAPVLTNLTVTKILACSTHTLAIANNQLYSFGSNIYGQLGLGDTTTRYTPTLVESLSNHSIVAVACGISHSLALTESGLVFAFGDNSYGQIGTGTTTVTLVPFRVQHILNTKKIIGITAAGQFSVALADDGSVYSWGRGVALGDGKFTGRTLPYPVSTLNGKRVKLISASPTSAYALLRDGTLYAWGSNTQGELGQTGISSSSVPIPVAFNSSYPIVSISGSPSSSFVLALASNGTAFGFGNNTFGSLGDGTYSTPKYPILTANSKPDRYITAVSAGRSHSYFLYTGTSCYGILFDDSTVCSWHGTCVALDTCVCRRGYSGLDCSYATCNNINSTEPHVCSSHGSCVDADVCVCQQGYRGQFCEIKQSGYLFGSGDNSDSQLADRNIGISTYPVISKIFAGKVMDLIVPGYKYSFVRDIQGSVFAVGKGTFGNLGDGTNTSHPLPVKILEGKTIVSMCAGYSHALAVDSTGKVYAFGTNNYGQLGLGHKVNTFLPTVVTALQDMNAVSVACGYYHSLVLMSTGKVYSFGRNSNGQLGINSKVLERTTPSQVVGLLTDKKMVQIAAGGFHSLALGSDGSVYAFGANSRGQLGDTTTFDKIVPIQVAGPLFGKPIRQIVAGLRFSVVLLGDSKIIYGWGSNSNYELNDGTTIDRTRPTQTLYLPSNMTISTITAGGTYVSVLMDNQTVLSYGDNTFGNLGNGEYNTSNIRPVVIKTDPYSLPLPTAVVAGNTHTLYLLDGISCFGKFSEDPTVCSSKGVCVAQDTCVCEPLYNAPDCSDYSCFGFGANDTEACSGKGMCVAADACICRPSYTGPECGERVSGYVFALGADNVGQLGDGYTFTQTIPTAVLGILSGRAISSVASGTDFSVAVTKDGTLIGWGTNSNGQLGTGDNLQKALPTEAVGLHGVKIQSVCAGQAHTAAVDSDGRVWTMGDNYYGQLGTGDYTFTDSYVPVRVEGMIENITIIAVACGQSHTLALSESGQVYGWGSSINGQLGTGDNSAQLLPVRVGIGSIDNVKIASIVAGYRHNLAIAPFGIVYGWGDNSFGQVAPVDTFPRYTPTLMTSGALNRHIAVSVAASEENSYVVGLDGSVVSSGGNFYGQIGDNTSVIQSKPIPQKIGQGSIKKALYAFAGRNNAFIVAANKTGFAWGGNNFGQLGDGTITATRNAPVPITNSYPQRFIQVVAPGSTHTLFLYNTTACYGFLADDPNVCSGRGLCIGNDQCLCQDGFKWQDCSMTECNGRNSSDPMVCGGHGNCLPSSTCVCHPTWKGSNCDKTSFGYVYGAGQDQSGQLADGGSTDRNTLVKGRATKINKVPMKYLSAGLSFSYIMSTIGDVFGVGLNDQGSLGDGTTNNARTPTEHLLGRNITYITAGYSFGAAIDKNNELWSFGSNLYGNLGIGVAGGQRPTPTRVPIDGQKVIQVSCSLGHCVYVTSKGDAYSFGANDRGQLGDGTQSSAKSNYNPIKLLGILAIKKSVQAFAAPYHSLALSVDGRVYGWGSNQRGQLGNNETSSSNQLIPTPVLGLDNEIVTQITGGEYFSCVLTNNTRVYCFGANEAGQLGTGDTVDRKLPTLVSALNNKNIVQIAAGSSGFMLALSSNGTVYSWGANTNGALMIGSTINKLTPGSVGNFTRSRAEYIAAGRFHSLVLFNGVTCYNVLQDDPEVCSGSGICVNTDTCICRSGFSGSNCEFTSCAGLNETDPNVCSGHGACVDLNKCACTDGEYMGDICEYDACFGFASNDAKVCSGYGRCIAPGNCSCDAGYVGKDCRYPVCHGRNSSDPQVCSGTGFCYSPDNCLCFNTPSPGYTGGNCSYPICLSRFVDRASGSESIVRLPAQTTDLVADTSQVCTGHGTCIAPRMCKCDLGYYDQYCSTPSCFGKNSTDPSVCNYGKNGTCIAYNNCTCLTFINDDGVCAPLVCFGKNSTTVPAACNADVDRGYCLNVDLCACRPGYGGKECEQTVCNGVLELNNTVCNSRGYCTNPDSCTCEEGYAGSDCEFSICDDIRSDNEEVCSGHGTCDGPDTCVCDEGYAGEYCQHIVCNDVWSNSSDVCSGFGKCLAPDSCECNYGYSGVDCAFASCFGINATASYVCSGHGDCLAPDRCTCDSGYVTLDCSIPVCYGVLSTNKTVCSGNGFCEAPNVCDCYEGRNGSNCQWNVCFDLEETQDGVCSNHGKCIGPNRCACEEGYTSRDCSIPICFKKPAYAPTVCSMEGECIAPDTCNCTTGRTGDQCQHNVCFGMNQTDSSVCSGKGSCDYPDICNCKLGYTGSVCQYAICSSISAEFTSNVCNGHGNCVGPNNCSCFNGYTGSKCEVTTCYGRTNNDTMVCSGHGNCTSTSDVCKCEEGYSGNDCSSIRTCDGLKFNDENVCSGSGKCTDEDVCTCDTGKSGQYCESNRCYGIDQTSGLVCSAHGDCIAVDSCSCHEGYTGDDCGVAICYNQNSVENSTTICSGHGECIKHNDCACSDGYSGSECETPVCFGIQANDSTVCQGRGMCIEPDFCLCSPGYTGSACEGSVGLCSGDNLLIGEGGALSLYDLSCGEVQTSLPREEEEEAVQTVFNKHTSQYLVFNATGVYNWNTIAGTYTFISSYQLSIHSVVNILSINQVLIVSVRGSVHIELMDVTTGTIRQIANDTSSTIVPELSDSKYITVDGNGNTFVFVYQGGSVCIMKVTLEGHSTIISKFEHFPTLNKVQALICNHVSSQLYVISDTHIYLVVGNRLTVEHYVLGQFFASTKVESDTKIYLNDYDRHMIMIIDRSSFHITVEYILYSDRLLNKQFVIIGGWIPVVSRIEPAEVSIISLTDKIVLNGAYLMFQDVSTVVLVNTQYGIIVEQPLLLCDEGSACFVPGIVNIPSELISLEFKVIISATGKLNPANSSIDYESVKSVTNIVIFKSEIMKMYPTTATFGSIIMITALYLPSNVECSFRTKNVTITTAPVLFSKTQIQCEVPAIAGLVQNEIVHISAAANGVEFSHSLFFYNLDVSGMPFFDTFDEPTFDKHFIRGWQQIPSCEIDWIDFDRVSSRSLLKLESSLPASGAVNTVIRTKNTVILNHYERVSVEFIAAESIGELLQLYVNVEDTSSYMFGSIVVAEDGSKYLSLTYKFGDIASGKAQNACNLEFNAAYTLSVHTVRSSTLQWSMHAELLLGQSVFCTVDIDPQLSSSNFTSHIQKKANVMIGQSALSTNSIVRNITVYVDRVWVDCQDDFECDKALDGTSNPDEPVPESRTGSSNRAALIGVSSGLGFAGLLLIILIITIIVFAVLFKCYHRRQQKTTKNLVAQASMSALEMQNI